MKISEKKELTNLLQDGKSGEVISRIIEIIERDSLNELRSYIVLISARYQKAQNGTDIGISSSDENNRELASINVALLNIIEELPIELEESVVQLEGKQLTMEDLRKIITDEISLIRKKESVCYFSAVRLKHIPTQKYLTCDSQLTSRNYDDWNLWEVYLSEKKSIHNLWMIRGSWEHDDKIDGKRRNSEGYRIGRPITYNECMTIMNLATHSSLHSHSIVFQGIHNDRTTMGMRYDVLGGIMNEKHAVDKEKNWGPGKGDGNDSWQLILKNGNGIWQNDSIFYLQHVETTKNAGNGSYYLAADNNSTIKLSDEKWHLAVYTRTHLDNSCEWILEID